MVVQKGMLKYGAHKALIVYQDAEGIFHRIKLSLPLHERPLRNEIITENEYIQIVARIFWETKANEEALLCATGGTENCSHVSRD